MIGRIRGLVSRQLSRPSGGIGRLVARAMNRGNRGINARAVEVLEVQEGERILDLGFGGGVGLDLLLARGARVTGVDRAADMVAAARGDRAGDSRLNLLQGEVSALPLPDAELDGVVTVNTVYFWPDLAPAFAEIRRVLAPGGRVVVGIRDCAVMTHVSAEVFTLRAPEEIAVVLEAAGFVDARIESAADQRAHFVRAQVPVEPSTF